MTEPQSPDLEGGDAPHPESLVGSVLADRYRLVKLLGWGAMGAVYVGEHLKIGRKDAIKVLKASLARDPEAVARFARGARNASAIRHPNVCTVYDFSDTSDGLQFLAMELVDGESLTSLLRREGPLSLDRAGRIAIQAASALQAAHDMGIVHRDMKPDNVMLTKDRDGNDLAKVVDFDIAKGSAEGEERGVTRMGFVVGTPEYMSPEQLTGDPLDGRSDVYSLGIVLFRMLSGDLPYRSRSTQELMVDRLTRDPLKLADVAPDRAFPAAVQRVLDRALARDRDDRPDNALAFARELWEAVYGPAAVAAANEEQPTESAPQAASEPPSASETSTPELPATVVAPRGDATFSPAATVAPPASTGRRRWLGWGAGAASLAVVGIIVASVLKASGAPEPSEVRVPASLAIQVGESARVEATVRAADGSVLPDVAVRWTSESPDVVTVDGLGVVHGVRAGTASVRAAAGTLEGATEVTVSGPDAPTAPVLDRSAVAFSVAGGGSARAESVEVGGAALAGGALTVRVAYASGAPDGWLEADLEGDTPPTRLSVRPARAPAAAGTYRASVIVGWGSGAPSDTVGVTLRVEDAEPPPSRGLTVAEAEDLSWRQLELVDHPTERARRAVQDSTGMIWRDTALPDSIRARAAFGYAQAAVLLGEREEGLRWAQRAVAAAPGAEAYRVFLEGLGGGGAP